MREGVYLNVASCDSSPLLPSTEGLEGEGASR